MSLDFENLIRLHKDDVLVEHGQLKKLNILSELTYNINRRGLLKPSHGTVTKPVSYPLTTLLGLGFVGIGGFVATFLISNLIHSPPKSAVLMGVFLLIIFSAVFFIIVGSRLILYIIASLNFKRTYARKLQENLLANGVIVIGEIRKIQDINIDTGLKYVAGQEIDYVFTDLQGATHLSTYFLHRVSEATVGSKILVLYVKEFNVAI